MSTATNTARFLPPTIGNSPAYLALVKELERVRHDSWATFAQKDAALAALDAFWDKHAVPAGWPLTPP